MINTVSSFRQTARTDGINHLFVLLILLALPFCNGPADLPFAPFSKGDLGRGNRVADFTVSTHQKYQKFPGRRGDELVVNEELQYKHDVAEDATFSLVDTSKTKKFGGGGGMGQRRQWGKGKGKGGKGKDTGPAMGKGGRGNLQAQRKRNDPRGNAFRAHGGRGKGKGKGGRVERQASVKVGAEWEVVDEMDLAQFTKLQTNKPVEEDLKWCGHLDDYDVAYDSVTTKSGRPLVRAETHEFYNVSTTDDPVIEELAAEEAGQVYATDAILAHLMACPRSVYPWDLVVQKMGDVVFIDKRDDSQFDYLTVSETANDPPAPNDDPDAINSPDNLSLEATSINQNFSQQVLKEGGREDMEMPNPFFDEEETGPGVQPASVAYRYRKFTLGKGTEKEVAVVARCELHGNTVKNKEKLRMTCFALNEWDSTQSGGVDWRQKLDSQRGAVMATEMKNNNCKLTKWAAQSVIAGADQMKIGALPPPPSYPLHLLPLPPPAASFRRGASVPPLSGLGEAPT